MDSKKQELKELAAKISVYSTNVTVQKKAKERELKDRLDFRMQELQKEYREKSLDLKIKVFKELLKELKK